MLYGHAEIVEGAAVEVRTEATFTVKYTVGRFGLDDTGAIRIVFRAMSDFRPLQTTDPGAPDFASATSSSSVPLTVSYVGRGNAARPRWKSLTVNVTGGYLSEGDVITVVLGDTSGGSRGWRVQTIAEAGFEFAVLADVCAVGHFVPIPESPSISILAGPPARWVCVLPSLRRPGEPFQLGIKAEDAWGNPSDTASAELRIESNVWVRGLPSTLSYGPGRRAVTIEGLSVEEAGTVRIAIFDESGTRLAESHPLVIREGGISGYWGDMHGQSGESIGLTTARQYFDFARNAAFLDATGHQANDFQVNNAFWAHLQELTSEHDEPGRFVAMPGYEWSGNTAVGGDRNVYFRTEGRQIRRSSHALLSDRSDIDTDANDANELFGALRANDEDCVVYAHVGGRYADTAFAHDPEFETAMEIHSAWGTFEWLLPDGFELGHRCGVVANSDGHKGRPGASYPGAAMFGAYGGLTCFLTHELSRDGIFDSLRRRHHYATTGTRMFLDVHARFEDAQVFDADPAVHEDATSTPTTRVMMGDIVSTTDSTTTVDIEVVAHSPVERVEIRNGTDVVDTFRPYGAEDLGRRVRVLWSGAEYRGRGRTTTWRGTARLDGNQIEQFAPVNSWNLERTPRLDGEASVVFDSITTGNFGGFDVLLHDATDGQLTIDTEHGSLTIPVSSIGMDDVVMEAGGLERRLKVFRLPDENPHRQCRAMFHVPLWDDGDNPLWVSVFTEDGFQAWSSPIFVFRP